MWKQEWMRDSSLVSTTKWRYEHMNLPHTKLVHLAIFFGISGRDRISPTTTARSLTGNSGDMTSSACKAHILPLNSWMSKVWDLQQHISLGKLEMNSTHILLDTCQYTLSDQKCVQFGRKKAQLEAVQKSPVLNPVRGSQSPSWKWLLCH